MRYNFFVLYIIDNEFDLWYNHIKIIYFWDILIGLLVTMLLLSQFQNK